MSFDEKQVFSYNGKSFFYGDIVRAIKKVGIKKNETIFVHSDIKDFGKINGNTTREYFIESFIKALKQSVGNKGNIIMPTFSYSYCRNELFDPKITPSRVGTLSEYFRKMSGSKRSTDAIFSVAVYGKDSSFFTKTGLECFGKDSIFEKMHERNGKFMFLGERFDMTYLHFIEQRFMVPYRFIKKFPGKTKIDGRIKKFVFNYYVKPLDKNISYDLQGISGYLEKCGVLKKAKLGQSKIRAVSAVDAFEVITAGLKKNPFFLLSKGVKINQRKTNA